MSRYPTDPRRRQWLLRRLAEADGPLYDELVGELIGEYPESTRHKAGMLAVRAVRSALWAELAVTESDESIWMTPRGWQALAGLKPDRRAS